MHASDTVLNRLKNQPWMKGYPSQDIARILPFISIQSFKTRDVLFRTGESARFIYIILSGECELTLKGNESIRIQNGFLGEEAAIGLPSYLCNCSFVSATELLCIPLDAIQKLIQHPPAAHSIRDSFAMRFPDTHSQTEEHQPRTPQPHSQVREKPADSATLPSSDKENTTFLNKETVGWLMLLLVPIGLYSTLSLYSDIPDQRMITLLTIISMSVVMWVFSLTSDFIPALLAILCILLTGIAPADVTLKGFSDHSFFMALSIFALSTVIMVSGLSYRILLLLLRLGPAHKAWYNFSLFITGHILTPIIPTTNGRVAIIAPFLKELVQSLSSEDARKEAPRLSASMLTGVSVFSAIFLTSKSVNFVIFGLLPLQEQTRFQWLSWLYAASVCGFILFLSYLLLAGLLFRNNARPEIPKEMIRQQLKALGPLSPSEWACIIGMLTLLLSFMTTSWHHIPIPWVSLTIMFALLLFGFLSKEHFQKKIDWSFLFFLASLIGVVSTMHYVGLENYLSHNLQWLVQYMMQSFEYFIFILAISIFIVRLILPINATIIIFATLLMPFAAQSGINPWVIGFIILLLSESYIWPYQASYYLQLLSITRNRACSDHPKVFIFNALMHFAKILAIYLSLPFWKSMGII